MKRAIRRGFTLLEILIVVGIIALINVTIGGVATQYLVEHWTGYFQGTAVHMPFLPCFIVSLFLAEITMPAAAITWFLTYIIPGL